MGLFDGKHERTYHDPPDERRCKKGHDGRIQKGREDGMAIALMEMGEEEHCQYVGRNYNEEDLYCDPAYVRQSGLYSKHC